MRKTMIISAFAGAMTLMTAGHADAQQGGQRGERSMRGGDPVQRVLQLQAELGLTEAQVAQLRQIQSQLEARNEPLREQMRAAMGEERGGMRGMGAMTPEQREARREAMRQMTPEQRRAMMEAQREQMRARREEMRQRSPEEREQARAERQARMQQMRPLMEQMRGNARAAWEQASSVLTAEQRATLEARREARGARRHRMREGGMRGGGRMHDGARQPMRSSAPRG